MIESLVMKEEEIEMNEDGVIEGRFVMTDLSGMIVLVIHGEIETEDEIADLTTGILGWIERRWIV